MTVGAPRGAVLGAFSGIWMDECRFREVAEEMRTVELVSTNCASFPETEAWTRALV